MFASIGRWIPTQKNKADLDELRDAFDAAFYLDRWPDVAAAGIDPVLHYHNLGWREGRDPSPDFETQFYLENNPDVAALDVDPYLHYIHNGRSEGRLPKPKDPASLSPQMFELVRQGFDTAFYLQRYPDVKTVGLEPIVHYCGKGWREGRNPTPHFDTNFYLSNNPDIAAAGVNPFWHHLNSGIAEGRLGKPDEAVLNFGKATTLDCAIPWREKPLELDDRMQCISLIFGSTSLREDASLSDKFGAYRKACEAFGCADVVYTASFGGYDQVSPIECTDPSVDYVLFTDDPEMAPEGWQTCLLPPLFDDPTRSARVLKSLPHLLFRNASRSLWIDGSTVMRAPNHIIPTLVAETGDADILLHRHSERHCVFAEALECKARSKDDPQRIDALMRALQAIGYPRHRGLYETAQLFRQHTPETALFNERWWEIMRDFSRRDQLAFPVVEWRMNMQISAMSGTQWIDRNFKNYLHTSKRPEAIDGVGVTLAMFIEDDPASTERAIQSLIEKTDQRGINLELIAIDNASGHETKTLLDLLEATYANLRLITNPKKMSRSVASNLAARTSQQEFLCFANSDIEIQDPSWLHRLLMVMQAHDHVAAVGPILLNEDLETQSAGIHVGGGPDGLSLPAEDIRHFQQPKTVDALSMACLLVRRSVHEQIGGFDQRFCHDRQDLDYCLRIKELGQALFLASDAEVTQHKVCSRDFDERTSVDNELLREKWQSRFALVNHCAEAVRSAPTYADIVAAHPLRYRTYDAVVEVICKNIHHLPISPDLVVGMTPSGLFPASQIAQLLSCEVVSFGQFVADPPPRDDNWSTVPNSSGETLRVLIVDDSIHSGRAFAQAVAALPNSYGGRAIEARFLAIFGSEAWHNEAQVTVLERCISPRIFQWNYRNHKIAQFSCFELDGVLCRTPAPMPNENGQYYLDLLQTAQPLTLPSHPIAAIVTSRHERYRSETESWLRRHEVEYGALHMMDLSSAEGRNRLQAHVSFKAEVYTGLQNTKLFVESESDQAKAIFEATGKPVICTETDFFHANES